MAEISYRRHRFMPAIIQHDRQRRPAEAGAKRPCGSPIRRSHSPKERPYAPCSEECSWKRQLASPTPADQVRVIVTPYQQRPRFMFPVASSPLTCRAKIDWLPPAFV